MGNFIQKKMAERKDRKQDNYYQKQRDVLSKTRKRFPPVTDEHRKAEKDLEKELITRVNKRVEEVERIDAEANKKMDALQLEVRDLQVDYQDLFIDLYKGFYNK